MQIEKIKYFIDLVECSNFTDTAKKNYVSQTTISQQIASLEKLFDIQLIDRKQIPIKPTQAGWVFYREAVILWKQYNMMKDKMTNFINGHIQVLNIECAGTMDIQTLLQYIPTFNEAHPNIKIELNKVLLSKVSDYLKKGVYDIAVAFDSEFYEKDDIKTVPLYEGRYCAVVSSKHSLYHQEEISLQALYKHPLVMLKPKIIGKSYNLMIEHAIADGFEPNIARTADDVETEIFYILTENLIGFFPDNYSLEYLKDDLKLIPIKESHHTFKIEMAYLKDNKNPALDLFVKHIRHWISQ